MCLIDVHRYDLVELFGTQSTFRTGHVTTTFYDVTNICSEIENFNFEDILLSYYDWFLKIIPKHLDAIIRKFLKIFLMVPRFAMTKLFTLLIGKSSNHKYPKLAFEKLWMYRKISEILCILKMKKNMIAYLILSNFRSIKTLSKKYGIRISF